MSHKTVCRKKLSWPSALFWTKSIPHDGGESSEIRTRLSRTHFHIGNFQQLLCQAADRSAAAFRVRLSHRPLLFIIICSRVSPAFTYLLFTPQLTPTASERFPSSSSHCYGEQDVSSPTSHIFVLTSLRMANITFRQQEQVAASCTLHSYTEMLHTTTKLSEICRARAHLCNLKRWTLLAPRSFLHELHNLNSCFVHWIARQTATLGCARLCFLTL